MVPKLAPQPLVETIKAALMGAADDESAFVRAAAVRTLARIAGGTKTEIPRVIEALGDPDAQVRLAAACFLGWRGLYKRSPTLVPALGRALADPDAQVREWSARSLGYLGLDAEAALPALRAVGKTRRSESANRPPRRSRPSRNRPSRSIRRPSPKPSPTWTIPTR